MFEVRNLSVAYGGLRALKEVSFKVSEGFVAIIGPNGSGKTTLLKALAGLIDYEGEIFVEGKPISSLDPVARRKLITYVPPYIQAMPDMNIGDILLVGESLNHSMLEYYVKVFDVDLLLERKVWEVSSGELQRALIARGLSRDSIIYGIDEPISHTDVKYQLRVLEELKRVSLRKRKHVLVASNQLNPLLRFANEVIALKNGEVYFSGYLNEFLNEDIIRGLYGINVKIVNVDSLIDVIPYS